MTFRSATIRWLTWACSWAMVLVVSRTASAAAPMCDERGASAIAPSPVLEARDERIDTGFPNGCDDPRPVTAALRSQNGGHPVPIATDSGFFDAWVRPVVPRLAKLAASDLLDGRSSPFPASPGYGRGVFRPPRA
jgi:hypothetical protein